MKPIDVKQLAHELIDSMPPDAKWKDILYEIFVRQEIELGLDDSRNDRIVPVEDIRKEYQLSL